jgi:hypothetical protein
MPFLNQSAPNWKQKLKELFLPKQALAFFPDYQEVTTISFTIEYTPTEPAGASSVLFLPGIMGSRLYEEGTQCGDFGEVQERWFSKDSCEQLRLKTTFLGESVNELFTTADQSSIVDETLGLNLYKSFLKNIEDMKNEEVIRDFKALPYDWRLMLEDVIKSSEVDGRIFADSVDSIQEGLLYQTIQGMAAESFSGKVSIVAHSNGGLLSKDFLYRLEQEDDPLLDKIDNLFLVGVPQSGTPESVVSLLHGSSIGGGFVLDQETGRELVNLMPALHHLLPSEDYFASNIAADFPVISFQSGELTSIWAEEFGGEIKTLNTLHKFMSKDSGRAKPNKTDLSQPEVVDGFLLNYANTTHTIQSAWVPPENLQVHQLAGTGVQTPVALTYFTDLECVSRSIAAGFKCTEYAPKLGYRITKVDAGDGTVAFPSATAMSDSDQVKHIIIDLFEYNDDKVNRKHRDLLEIEDVQNYIADYIVTSLDSEYEYLSRIPVTSQNEQKIVFQLHSPLDMKIVANGRELSSSTKEIRGGTYERYGEVQYISIPTSVDSFELNLTGLAEGSFTLEIEEWQGNEMKERKDFVAVPSTRGTEVVMSVSDTSSLPRTFTIDYDGDGVVDAIVSEDGSVESLVFEEEVLDSSVTEDRQTSSGLSGTRVRFETVTGQVAGIQTSLNQEDVYLQELARLLSELSRLLTLLGKM